MKDFVFVVFMMQLLMLAGALAGIVILNIRLYKIEYWLSRMKTRLKGWEEEK